MRHWATRAAATVMVFVAAVGLVRAGEGVPATGPSAAALAPTTRIGDAGGRVERILLHPRSSRGTGTPISIDPVQAAMVEGGGTFKPVGDGWAATPITCNDKGEFEAPELSGGYAYTEVESDSDRVMLLCASGHAMVYVNGEPRGGDVYSTGYMKLPVKLHAGTNRLLFLGGRGGLTARFEPVTGPVMVLTGDATLPDVVAGGGQALSTVAGVVMVNASDEVLALSGGVHAGEGEERGDAVFQTQIPPMTVRKVVVPVIVQPEDSQNGVKEVSFTVRVGTGKTEAKSKFSLRVRRPEQTRKVTFVSQMDGSAQYYAVVPAIGGTGGLVAAGGGGGVDGPKKALVLSLHGASVEATSQADAYSAKPWCNIVCPTNRRPFGFDWEDWGRKDAMEVLGLAKGSLQADPTRIYLTGHSMGGHGTWQFGAHFPGTFAGLGPSAGWISFATYNPARAATGPSSRPAVDAFKAAALPSDTLALKENYKWAGIYILHGDADDNVPVAQARQMAKTLGEFHHDWQLFEQNGAGHWWSEGDEPGARCVDWREMFAMFRRHRLAREDELTEISFATASPEIHSKVGWVEVLTLETPGKVGRVDLRRVGAEGRIVGTTENVSRLKLSEVGEVGKSASVQIDGQKVETGGETVIALVRQNGRWVSEQGFDGVPKLPGCYGPLKEAFSEKMVFAYSTGGTAEENALSYAKARYDAEQWYYRGNGAVDVVSDEEANKMAFGRNLILYGNSETNKAWVRIGGGCPIQVTRTAVTVGGRVLEGEGLYAAFCYPKLGGGMVGVIAPTGVKGARAALRMPIFASSVYWPDYAVVDASALREGVVGIRDAGFFDGVWGLRK